MADTNIAAKLLSDLKRDFGLTDEQAAGVVGNLMHESGGFNSLQEINPSSGRGGYGYAQWTGDRRNAFENYAATNGYDPTSYEANYGYLKHELATDPYERRQFNTVKNATTAAEAARLVSENFLRPGTPNLRARQNYAQQALGYANSPVPPGSIPSPPGSAVGTQLSVMRPRVAPTPASVEDRVTARNTAPSPLQTALDAFAMRRRNEVTPASVEDRVTARNKAPVPPVMTPSKAARRAALSIGSSQTYAGKETSPALAGLTAQGAAPSASDMARGNTPAPEVKPVATFSASDMARGRPAPIVEDRLAPSPGGLPANFGTMTPQQVSTIGVPVGNTVDPQTGLRTTQEPTLVASNAPVPFQRPVAPAVQAPVAAPVMRPPVLAPQVSRGPVMRAPLNILVDGSNTAQPRPQSVVNQIRNEGYTEQQAYDIANERAAERALASATAGHSTSGGMRYDPNGGPSGSGGFVRVR